MPGVRYGPDISDDAAYILNQIVSLQDVEADLKRRGRKLTDRDSKTLARNVKAAQTFFGVSAADIKKRKFGDMGTLAQYSMEGINVSRRKRGANGKWVYAKSKRSKLAKGKDGLEKRSVAEEHVKYRGANPGRTFTKADDTKAVRKKNDPVGGGTYLGRTSPRKFMDAQKRFYDRMSKKGAVSYGNQPARKIRGQDDLDKVNIAKQYGKSIRPRMTTSRPGGRRKATPKTPAQLKREKTIANAGRRSGTMSTAKKARGAKKPTKPRKRAK